MTLVYVWLSLLSLFVLWFFYWFIMISQHNRDTIERIVENIRREMQKIVDRVKK